MCSAERHSTRRLLDICPACNRIGHVHETRYIGRRPDDEIGFVAVYAVFCQAWCAAERDTMMGVSSEPPAARLHLHLHLHLHLQACGAAEVRHCWQPGPMFY